MPMLSERAKTGYTCAKWLMVQFELLRWCAKNALAFQRTHTHKNKYGKIIKEQNKICTIFADGKINGTQRAPLRFIIFRRTLFLLHLIHYSMRWPVRVTQIDESNRFLFRAVHFLLCWLNKIVWNLLAFLLCTFSYFFFLLLLLLLDGWWKILIELYMTEVIQFFILERWQCVLFLIFRFCHFDCCCWGCLHWSESVCIVVLLTAGTSHLKLFVCIKWLSMPSCSNIAYFQTVIIMAEVATTSTMTTNTTSRSEKKTDNCELSFVTFLTAKYIKKNGDEEEEEEVKKRYYDFSFGRNRMLCSVQCVRHESMIVLCLYIINMRENVSGKIKNWK